MKTSKSLRYVLTVNIVVSALLPLLVVGVVALTMLERHLSEEITEKNLLLATSLVSEMNGFLETSLSILEQTGELLRQEPSFSDERLQAHLDVKISRYASLAMLRILDSHARVTHMSPFDKNYIGIDMSGHAFIQKAQSSDRPVWSSTFISIDTRQPTLAVSQAFQERIVIAYLHLTPLNALTNRVRIGTSGYAALIDRQGKLITHPDRSLVSEQVNISYAPAIRKGLQGQEGTFRVEGPRGPEFSSIAIVPHTEWLVAVIQPVNEALHPVTRIRNLLLGGAMGAIALAVVVMLHVVQKTLRPLNRLAKHSQGVASGDYTPLAKQTSYREVSELTDSFRQMLEAIRDREDALKANSEKLEEMVEERTRELREALEHLVRHEKLAVLGQMAGSVGHELRNPLTTISNAVYYLTMVLSESPENIIEYLEIIRSETQNAEKIISDLLDFARIKSLQRQALRIIDTLELILEKHPPPENIGFRLEIADDFPKVLVDPKHLEQVLSNLIVNAYQAMENGGTLTISASLNAEQAVIRLSDTGCGIAPENLNTVFEPLFTTKPRGIGLGLAVCKNLIEANEGSIEIESDRGQGATFLIRLPVAKGNLKNNLY